MLLTLPLLSSCQQNEKEAVDLTSLKDQFLETIYTADVEEGPFHFNYKFRTVFFSKEVISLFGQLSVHDRMPHGWKQYEGRTFCKINGQFKEISLDDLFITDEQKEFLRVTCEESLKNDPISYFSGNEPLHTRLKQEELHTFVVDDQHLIIIFQPYSVGSGADGPFVVKIPFDRLKGHWNISHPLFSLMHVTLRSHEYISSWNIDDKLYQALTYEENEG